MLFMRKTESIEEGSVVCMLKQMFFEWCQLHINHLVQKLSINVNSITSQVLKYCFFKVLTQELCHTVILQYLLGKVEDVNMALCS